MGVVRKEDHQKVLFPRSPGNRDVKCFGGQEMLPAPEGSAGEPGPALPPHYTHLGQRASLFTDLVLSVFLKPLTSRFSDGLGWVA